MSVIPLSHVEPDAEAIAHEAAIERDRQERHDNHESALDRMAAQVADAIVERNEDKPTKRQSLDEIISSQLNEDGESNAAPSATDQIADAIPAHEELQRVSGLKRPVGQTIADFLSWDDAFRENPSFAAEQFEAQFRKGYTVDGAMRLNAETQPASEPPKDADKSVKLSWHLDRAMEKAAQRERANDEAPVSAKQIERLKERFPDLSPAEAIKRATHIFTEGLRDPRGTAERLAAPYGAPVTPLLKEVAAVESQVNEREANFIQMENAGELPDLNRHAPAMLEIIQRPDFVRTADERFDVRRAHRLAQIFEAEKTQAVEKAKRAAPVKSSSGHAGNAPHKTAGLDGAINSALSEYAA